MSKVSARELTGRHMQAICRAFAPLLAQRLGRSVAEIHDEGLGAFDFKLDESVELILADGSTMCFRYAFAVIDESERLVAIFSEHCGYFCFSMANLTLTERKGERAVRHVW